MAIRIIDTTQFNVRLKATIQATGKLGFTRDTAKTLELEAGGGVNFAKDDATNELYMIIIDHEDASAFKVCKSGAYFYIPTKLMFDSLGMEYAIKNVMFDLIRMPELDEELNGKTYKMNQRINERPMRKE